MTTQSVGFIGGGRVTRILLGGWRRADCLPRHVAVCDPDPAARGLLEQSFGTSVATGADPASASRMDVVVLAVHPPVLETALAAIRPQLRSDTVVLSLAPKVAMAPMASALGGFRRLARAIPNAPSIVGAGYNPVAFGPGLGTAGRRAVVDLLAPLGECPEVPEEDLEAYAVVSAMGPTYLWFQLCALRDLGVDFGLSSAAALRATARMAWGSAGVLLDGSLSEAEVMDLVPVRPLAEHEADIVGAYRSVLPPLYEKLAGKHLAAAMT